MFNNRNSAILLAAVGVALLPATGFAFILGRRKRLAEAVVKTYFEGVNLKDAAQIENCFRKDGIPVKLRDVCGVNQETREASPKDLAQRCMDFVTAHPDCLVRFHYGPSCSRDSNWVVAHWYETGTWSGESCGIPPTNKAMNCEGQTRFLVDPKTNLITEFVVTRTFTEWENEFIRRQASQELKP